MRGLDNYWSFWLRMFADNVVCLDHGDNRLAYSKYNSYELGSNIQAVIHLLASNAATL